MFFMGECQNDIMTILSDKKYMASVKENVYIINNLKSKF